MHETTDSDPRFFSYFKNSCVKHIPCDACNKKKLLNVFFPFAKKLKNFSTKKKKSLLIVYFIQLKIILLQTKTLTKKN